MADTWRFVARTGATDTIYGLAVSPDSQLLATASWDSTVRVLDLAAGRTLQTLRGHEGRVYSVAFHPEGRLLASGGTDAVVRVWDAETGEALWSQSGHSSLIYSVAFQPQGEFLASGSEDGTVAIWTQLGERVHHIEGHNQYVQGVAFSPDGRLLASGSRDQFLILWDVASGAEVGRVEVIHNGINSVRFTADGQRVLLTNVDGVVGVWDLTTGALLQERNEHRYPVWTAVFSPDGRTFATGSADRTIMLWDTVTGEQLGRLTGHVGDVYGLEYTPDGRFLISGSADKTIRLWGRDLPAAEWEALGARWAQNDEAERAAAAPGSGQAGADRRPGWALRPSVRPPRMSADDASGNETRNQDQVSKAVVLVLALGISALFLAMIQNFLMALFLAGVFSALASPLFLRLTALFNGRRGLASLATLSIMAVVVLIPLILLSGVLISQAIDVSQFGRRLVEGDHQPTRRTLGVAAPPALLRSVVALLGQARAAGRRRGGGPEHGPGRGAVLGRTGRREPGLHDLRVPLQPVFSADGRRPADRAHPLLPPAQDRGRAAVVGEIHLRDAGDAARARC